MPSDDQPASARSVPLGPVEPRCLACGYDLRGAESPRCPECGTPRAVRLEFEDAGRYRMASTALAGTDLALRAREPGGNVMSVVSGAPTTSGAIWIAMDREADVLAIMEDAGVALQGLALPIVDRAEPQCPSCGDALDPGGVARCPRCRVEFQWVSIVDPDIDTTGVPCRKCEYDLTGVSGDRCPECGEPVANLDALVAAALGDDRNLGAGDARPAPARGKASWIWFAVKVFSFPVAFMLAAPFMRSTVALIPAFATVALLTYVQDRIARRGPAARRGAD